MDPYEHLFLSRAEAAKRKAHAEDQLIRDLMNHDLPAKKRAEACSGLGIMRSRRALPFLFCVATSATSHIVRWEAVLAIGLVGSKRLTRPLIAFLRKNTSVPIKRAAVIALGLLADDRSRWALTRRLEDQDEDTGVRGLAAEALGLLRLKRSTERALVRALSDKSVSVRYSSLCAVAAHRIYSARPEIARLLDDEEIGDQHITVAVKAHQVLSEMATWGAVKIL